MKNNLIKILGILTLLAIPKNINEQYKIEPNYNLKNIKQIYNEIEYKKEIDFIKDRIYVLNLKKGFFSERLKQKDILPEGIGKYTKDLEDTKKKLTKYEKEKDSICNLLKR